MSSTVISPPHTKWGLTIAIALGAAFAVALIVVAFVWSTATSAVRDIPIAIAGTSEQVHAVTEALDRNAPGAFVFTTVDSRGAAVDLINTRDVYGAIVLSGSPEVLTASADGVAVSQILGQLATQLGAQATQAAQAGVSQAVAAGAAPASTIAPTIVFATTDVVPLAWTDARGAGLTAAAFPLVLGGMLGGIIISLLVTGSRRRLTAVAVYAVVAGLGVVGIMQGWFGILQGSFVLNAAAVALATAATASFVVGANALLGRPGIAVGSVVTMLVGNPISSAAQPLQFLVAPWGSVGQWFVPGASATLVRDLSYFPAANTTFGWLVLAGWAVLGLIAMLAGHFRNQEVVHLDSALEGE